MLVTVGGFLGLMLLPTNFSFPIFAAMLVLLGVGTGMFTSPNSSSIMGSVPANQRGAASGTRGTFQNSGTALSIGIFFSLMIAGLSGSLRTNLTSGLIHAGLPHALAQQAGNLPPVSTLFASVLGVNPIHHILVSSGTLGSLSPTARAALTGRSFFPHLIEAPFHSGLTVVFLMSIALSLVAAFASMLRGGRVPVTAAS